jgi:hypothetical protein
VKEDRQFELVYESPDSIAPDPYPNFAFPGWDCNWTRGGITEGERIKITRPKKYVANSRSALAPVVYENRR